MSECTSEMELAVSYFYGHVLKTHSGSRYVDSVKTKSLNPSCPLISNARLLMLENRAGMLSVQVK